MSFAQDHSTDSRYKNIVYNSTIIAQGNVHIGDVYYNVSDSFHHAVLFFKLEKTEEINTWLAQLSIKSKHHTISQLLRQKVKVDIAPALFKQVAGFQEVRRLDELTFRGLGQITPENIRIEEEYLVKEIFDTFIQGDILTVCQDFIDLLEKRKISELMLAVSCEDNAVVNLPFEMVIPKFFPEKLGEKRQSLAVNHFGFVRTLETSLEGFEMQGKPSDTAPLKLLFVTALPENLSERSKMLEIEDEQKRLIDAIGSFEATGGEPKIVIEFLDTASLSEINNALQKHRHHIVHISGHGKYKENVKQGVLHLEDEEGKHIEITGKQLGEILRPHQCIKLLILSACETAVAGNGVVEQLAAFGIPALVAMRFSVTDPAAILFTTELYTALVRGETLTLALAQAREALWQRLEEQRRIHPDYVHLAEWFTPVTYLNQYIEALVNPKGNYVLPEDFYPRSDFFKTKNTRLIGAGFVGRKRYLNQLRRYFVRGTHVCLHGLGGLGKTTLAEAFANNYDNHSHELLIFRGGSQLLEKPILDELLARLESDEKTNKNMVRHLKNHLESDATPTEKLQSLITNYLQNRKTILVFDNFEDAQRTEGGEQQREIGNESLRDFYQYLCQNTPQNCHLLFTSRYTIADLSTTVTHLALDKMTYAEQYRLSNFSPTLRCIPMTDRQEVFKRLDGHPRAFEFLESLLKNGKNLNWTTIASSVGQAESEAVESLLLSSIYDRLSPKLQQLLQMASVFITRTPITALQHLNPPMGTASLSTLSDWSLCFLDDNEHFEIHRLTKEWINQYKVSGEDRKSWALKTAEFYKEKFTPLDNEFAISYYEIAEAWEEFVEVSFRLQHYFQQKGFYEKAHELNKVVLEKNISFIINQEALNNIGAIFLHIHQYDNALKNLKLSLDINRKIENIQGEEINLINISQIHKSKGEYDIALKYLRQGLRLQQLSKNKPFTAIALNNIGRIYYEKCKYNTALKFLKKGLKIRQKIKDRKGEANSLHNISPIYKFRGDYETAFNYLQQSLTIRQEISDYEGQSNTLNSIGQLYSARGDYDKALEYLQQSLIISQHIGNQKGERLTLNNISRIHNIKENKVLAIEVLEKCLSIQQAIGDRKGQSITLTDLATMCFEIGDFKSMSIFAQQNLKLQEELNDLNGLAMTYHMLGDIELSKMSWETALKYFLDSYNILKKINSSNIQYTKIPLDIIKSQIGEAKYQEIVDKITRQNP